MDNIEIIFLREKLDNICKDLLLSKQRINAVEESYLTFVDLGREWWKILMKK